jgi:hypothetical protein
VKGGGRIDVDNENIEIYPTRRNVKNSQAVVIPFNNLSQLTIKRSVIWWVVAIGVLFFLGGIGSISEGGVENAVYGVIFMLIALSGFWSAFKRRALVWHYSSGEKRTFKSGNVSMIRVLTKITRERVPTAEIRDV